MPGTTQLEQYLTIMPGLTERQRLNLCLIYVFPNYFINPWPDITYYVRMYPLGPGRIRMFLDYLVPPHMEDGPELQKKLDELEVFVNKFNDEDIAVCNRISREGLMHPRAIIYGWLNNHIKEYETIAKLIKISIDYAKISKRNVRIDDAIRRFYEEERDVLRGALAEGIKCGDFRKVDVDETASFISTAYSRGL